MLTPCWTDGERTIYHGNCLEIAPQLDLVTGIVTDPPYELGFMGKAWDKQGISFQPDTWRILREACKPGAMLLSFGGTRTFHRMAAAIEDAGWELRDTIMWLYGSGFPKSLDISKAIDKDNGKKVNLRNFTKWFDDVCKERNLNNRQIDEYLGLDSNGATASHYRCIEGQQPRFPRLELYYKLQKWLEFGNQWDGVIVEAEREVIEERIRTPVNDGTGNDYGIYGDDASITVPATPEAQLWAGYGTALKPAYEPILVCMNPIDGTFANNALKHGVAGLNIDGSRIPLEGIENHKTAAKSGLGKHGIYGDSTIEEITGKDLVRYTSSGRFPANIIHDGSDEVLELFPQSAGQQGDLLNHNKKRKSPHGIFGEMPPATDHLKRNDSGSAARFFYCAKASKSERGEDNKHPTVKPLALMKYLVKLIAPPKDAILLDPFMGSGSTLVACKELGIKCIGIDTDEYNCEIAAKRCQAAKRCCQNGVKGIVNGLD